MQELHIDSMLTRLRKEAGLTQDEVAKAMDVSKSSVSKWESGATYPDITMLPKLAVFFNVSVDEILNYTSLLSEKQINEFYVEMTEEITKDAEGTFDKIDQMIKKYYSCFPFLKEMSIFFMNNYTLAKEPEKKLESAIKLCNRIKENAKDSVLLTQTDTIEGMLYLLLKKPKEAIKIFEPQNVIISQNPELLCQALLLDGNSKKALQYYQACIYQHLLFLLQDSMAFLTVNRQDKDSCEKTIERIKVLMKTYEVNELHPFTALSVYQTFIIYTLSQGQIKSALGYLNEFTDIIEKIIKSDRLIHGDTYFDKIDDWVKEQMIRYQAPRSKDTILNEIINFLEQNPLFISVREEAVYLRCLEKLKTLKKGR